MGLKECGHKWNDGDNDIFHPRHVCYIETDGSPHVHHCKYCPAAR